MTDWDPDEPAPPHTDDDAPEWLDPWELPAPNTYTTTPTPTPDDDTEHTTWWPINLAQLFDGNYQPLQPAILARSDGQHIIYPGKAHAFNGAPECGKSWAALYACVQTINDGQPVLYLDFEDTAPTVVSRLLALGADPHNVLTHLAYMAPSEPLWSRDKYTPAGLEFDEWTHDRALHLTIIDGVTEAMGLHGLDINSNNDVAQFYNRLPRRILDRTGSATVQIDHIPKNPEGRGRGGIGGQHKLAGIDVSYLFETKAPFGIGQHGTSRIHVEKDRPGQLRQHAVGSRHIIAEFHLASDPDTHTLTASLDHYEPNPGAKPTFEPTTLMQRVSEYVAECNDNDNYPSQRDIEAAVKGKGEYIREAIARLVQHGHLRKGGDGRRITEHTIVTPFTATDSDDPGDF